MKNLKTAHYCESFAPIISDCPKLLILGTMPSVKSLESRFYYAHPRNQFWPIMQSITGLSIHSESEKRALIEKTGLALWDVLQACERRGSLDSAIQKPVANDFEKLFHGLPNINYIAFNGKKAEQLFKQYVIKTQRLPKSLAFITLPSTSPANAVMSVEDKQLFWQEKISKLL